MTTTLEPQLSGKEARCLQLLALYGCRERILSDLEQARPGQWTDLDGVARRWALDGVDIVGHTLLRNTLAEAADWLVEEGLAVPRYATDCSVIRLAKQEDFAE
jgi:hypothetical protein